MGVRACSGLVRMHAERRSVCHDESSSGVYLIATRTGARASSVYAYAVSMVAAIAGTSVRLRYRRYQRSYRFPSRAVQPFRFSNRGRSRQPASRLRGRRGLRRLSQRPVRPPENPRLCRHTLRGLVHRCGVPEPPFGVRRRPPARRSGDRCCIPACAAVHRGECAAAHSWPAGNVQPDGHRERDPHRLPGQLAPVRIWTAAGVGCLPLPPCPQSRSGSR